MSKMPVMHEDRRIFRERLDGALSHLDLDVSEDVRQRMWKHFELVREANRQFNLTRITDPREAARKHYADSVALLGLVDGALRSSARDGERIGRVLDAGTGAGFPAVPLAMVRPSWAVTALDKTGKKVRFVEECCRSLGLSNLEPVQNRLPDWQPAEAFDLVVFRAVGSSADCLRMARNVVRPAGWVICYKSMNMLEREIEAARDWCIRHDWSVGPRFAYSMLPRAHARDRCLMAYRKSP